MINNYCKKCNIEIETSECSICGERAEVKSQLYWCEKCNVPLYDEKCCICGTTGKKSTTDIRPVFPEERLLLEILIGKPFKYLKSSVWNGAGNRYIVDGKSIKVSISDLMKMDSKVVISKLNELKEQNTYEYFNEYIEKFKKANKARFNYIVSEATQYIIDQKKDYGDDETFVSFSGGKDSTVVSDLVVRALGNPGVIHIFGDTTLEFPMTEEYAKRFRANEEFFKALLKDKKLFEDIRDALGSAIYSRVENNVMNYGLPDKMMHGMFDLVQPETKQLVADKNIDK